MGHRPARIDQSIEVRERGNIGENGRGKGVESQVPEHCKRYQTLNERLRRGRGPSNGPRSING